MMAHMVVCGPSAMIQRPCGGELCPLGILLQWYTGNMTTEASQQRDARKAGRPNLSGAGRSGVSRGLAMCPANTDLSLMTGC